MSVSLVKPVASDCTCGGDVNGMGLHAGACAYLTRRMRECERTAYSEGMLYGTRTELAGATIRAAGFPYRQTMVWPRPLRSGIASYRAGSVSDIKPNEQRMNP